MQKYLFKILFFISIILFFFIPYIIIENRCGVSLLIKSSQTFGIKHSSSICYKRVSSAIDYVINRLYEKLNIPSKKINKNQFASSSKFILNKEDFDKFIKLKNDYSGPDNYTVEGLEKNIEKYLVKKDTLNYSDEFNSWIRSHGGNKNLKFSGSKYLNTTNVKNLKLVWKYKSKNYEESKWRQNVETNPVFYNGNLFFLSSDNKIISLNAKTGDYNWSIESLENLSRRGIVIDTTKNESIYVPIGNRIYKFHLKNGKIYKRFGLNGYINAKTKTAPFIYKDNLCYAKLVFVECVNKINGNKKFSINVHPKNKNFKGGIVWGGIAFDKVYEIVYVVTGNPRPALIGVNRPGKNKNSNSIVAIDLKKKKIIWTFQDVMHDLWDYDLSHPPIIADIEYEKGVFESVIVVGKTGNVHILHRYSGKHLFSKNFSKVKQSLIPGEITSKYQININKPEKLIDIGSYEEQIRRKDYLNNERNLKDSLDYIDFGFFHPPSFGKKLITLGLHGGATWPGSSFNPLKNMLFTPVNNIPFQLKIEARTQSEKKPLSKFISLYENKCSSCHGQFRNGSSFNPNSKKDVEILRDYIPGLIGHSIFYNIKEFNKFFSLENFKRLHGKNFKNISNKDLNEIKGLFKEWDDLIFDKEPLFLQYFWSKFLNKKEKYLIPGPLSQIVATNVVSGQIKWKTNMPSVSYGGLASNAGGIIVSVGTSDNLVYVLDQKTGDILWRFEMEAAGSAPPIFFTIDGKEYFSVISTGGLFKDYKEKSATIYTFSVD